MATSLMKKAAKKAGGGTFKKPDVGQFVPPELRDTVDRVAAAGMKFMYSPQAREEVQKAVQADMPMAQKLANNVAGLMLILDQKSQGGIPVEAVFPAAVQLLGEAAEVMQAAGQEVSQMDFNDAARMVFVILGKKMGGTDDEIMGAAQAVVSARAGQGETPPEDAEQEGPAHEAAPGDMAEDMQEGEELS